MGTSFSYSGTQRKSSIMASSYRSLTSSACCFFCSDIPGCRMSVLCTLGYYIYTSLQFHHTKRTLYSHPLKWWSGCKTESEPIVSWRSNSGRSLIFYRTSGQHGLYDGLGLRMVRFLYGNECGAEAMHSTEVVTQGQ